jgi:hypothetical protein
MTFEEILDQVLAMLQRRGRISYRAMMRQFVLDEAYLEDLKEAILFAHPQIIDEEAEAWSGPAIPAPYHHQFLHPRSFWNNPSH